MLALPVAMTVLCACGGGGGGGVGPAPPTNPGGNVPVAPELEPADITFVRDNDAGLNERAFGGGALTLMSDPELFSGGIAAADYDGDGDVDLYVVGGNTTPNHLYQDQGDGTYVEVAASVGLDITHWGAAPHSAMSTATATSTCSSARWRATRSTSSRTGCARTAGSST